MLEEATNDAKEYLAKSPTTKLTLSEFSRRDSDSVSFVHLPLSLKQNGTKKKLCEYVKYHVVNLS